ncbi:uncharacterized protein LOC111830084 [Capsella rubella]|uniref:uncharacterized protein LOC111830084 n=1 Tax=Capsella rubella TaxID=81985 RepID=UPI000CD55B4F|nr:uncharacterized protein LOC111830084 [Capsella rubella]
MRVCRLRLPQYEDVRCWKVVQSFAILDVLSHFRRHYGSQSLKTFIPAFGVTLNGSPFVSDRLSGESIVPCIEDFVSLVLTCLVAKVLAPNTSFGFRFVEDRLCEGLGFTKEDLCDKKSQPIKDMIKSDDTTIIDGLIWTGYSSMKRAQSSKGR